MCQGQGRKAMIRSYDDASLGSIIDGLCGKSQKTQCSVVKVDPRNTSQLCCGCNAYVRKDLSVRTHKCWYCGLEIDRDLNASINVLKTAVGCTASVSVRKPQDISPRTIVYQPKG